MPLRGPRSTPGPIRCGGRCRGGAARAGWASGLGWPSSGGRRGGHCTDSLSHTPGSGGTGNPDCRLGSPGLEALLSPSSAVPLQGPEKLCDHLEEDSCVRGPESPVHNLAGRQPQESPVHDPQGRQPQESLSTTWRAGNPRSLPFTTWRAGNPRSLCPRPTGQATQERLPMLRSDHMEGAAPALCWLQELSHLDA